jgi:cobalt-zinc-cadmium efflux system outer membrane protein
MQHSGIDMKTSLHVFLTVCGAALCAFNAGATPLNLDDARTLALSRAPQLKALDAASQAQDQEAIAAGQWPDPKIRLGQEKLPLSKRYNDSQSMDVIGIVQTIPGGNKTGLASRFRQLNAEKMRLDQQALRLEIRRDAGLAWLDAVYPLARLKLLNQQRDALERRARATRMALTQGRAGLAEAESVNRTKLLLQDRIAAAQTEADKNRVLLERWLGTVMLPDQLPQLAPPPPLAELETRLGRHPVALALEKSTDIARNALLQARESRVPDWDLELSYGRARTPGMPNTITAMVSFNLPILEGRRQNRQVAARDLETGAALASQEAGWRELRAGLFASYADWYGQNERLARLEPELKVRSSRLVDAGLLGYRNGSGSLSRVLETRENALDDALQLLERRYLLDRARLMVEFYDLSRLAGQEHQS